MFKCLILRFNNCEAQGKGRAEGQFTGRSLNGHILIIHC